jgi:alpha-L-fucosidase
VGKIQYAQLLKDASEVKYVEQKEDISGIYTTMPTKANTVTFEVPIQQPDVVPVIEIFLK